MASLSARLSSISSSLDELTQRVQALADEESGLKHDQTAGELEEAERLLRAGVRRLDRLLTTLPR